MRNIDEHAHFVHRLYDLYSVVADPAINPFRGAASDKILSIISQLRAPQSQFVERFDVLRFPKLVGVLQSHDDGDLLLGLCAIQVVGFAHQGKNVRIAPDKSAPCGDKFQRVVIGGCTADPDGIMKSGYATCPKHGGLRLGQRQRVGFGTKIQLKRCEHVDHERALHQVQNLGRILVLGFLSSRGLRGIAFRQRQRRHRPSHCLQCAAAGHWKVRVGHRLLILISCRN